MLHKISYLHFLSFTSCVPHISSIQFSFSLSKKITFINLSLSLSWEPPDFIQLFFVFLLFTSFCYEQKKRNEIRSLSKQNNNSYPRNWQNILCENPIFSLRIFVDLTDSSYTIYRKRLKTRRKKTFYRDSHWIFSSFTVRLIIYMAKLTNILYFVRFLCQDINCDFKHADGQKDKFDHRYLTCSWSPKRVCRSQCIFCLLHVLRAGLRIWIWLDPRDLVPKSSDSKPNPVFFYY